MRAVMDETMDGWAMAMVGISKAFMTGGLLGSSEF